MVLRVTGVLASWTRGTFVERMNPLVKDENALMNHILTHGTPNHPVFYYEISHSDQFSSWSSIFPSFETRSLTTTQPPFILLIGLLSRNEATNLGI